MAQEFRQGGYKSLGEALDHYLNPEESNPNTVRRFLGNLYGNAREMVGMDEESIIKNLEDRQAALELSKRELGQKEYTGNLDSLQDRAKDFYINLGSNVGAVSPVKQSIKSIISKQEKASNLAKFMEGSKVVDDNGNPLIVYHGTNKYFSKFDPKMLGKSTLGGSGTKYGFFFGDSPDYAKYWADNAVDNYGGVQTIKQSYLNLKKIAEIFDEGDGGLSIENGLKEAYESGNFDGAKIHMKNDYPGGESIAYVVFNSKKFPQNKAAIKSATGNRGTFDPNDPNILHGASLAGFGQKKEEKKESRLKSFGSKR